MDKTMILKELTDGRNCAQVVCGAFADETGYDIEETDRMASHFGGGMHTGRTCGAFTGGLMALGLTEKGIEDFEEFEKKFKDRFGSCVCFELLGRQIPKEAKESGKTLEVCPEYIKGAIEILEEIIK